MNYTITTSPIRLREFGRNFQSMIEYALTIENRVQRTRLAHQIVKIMGQMHPNPKDTLEFKQFLWDSLFVMSDFRLDVDAPFDIPTRESYAKKTIIPIPYRFKMPRMAHYGKNIEAMLDKIAVMSDENEKKWEALARVIHFMRLCLEAQERSGSLEQIIADNVRAISRGKVALTVGDVIALEEDFGLQPFNRAKIVQPVSQIASLKTKKKKVKSELEQPGQLKNPVMDKRPSDKKVMNNPMKGSFGMMDKSGKKRKKY